MTHDKFLIRMVTYEKEEESPTVIVTFYTTQMNELLKTFLTIKEAEIEMEIPNNNTGSSRFNDHSAYIEDIIYNFGGGPDDNLTGIDVIVEVV